MNARLFLASLFVFASALALAADEDAIAAQLLKEKEAYVAAQAKAKEALLKVLDKHYETIKSSKTLKVDVQLAQLEQIEAERKAFDENGVPPTIPALKVAVSEYRAAQKKADGQCKAAFEKAAKAYRDGGDLKAAAGALSEMKEFLARSPGAAAVPAGAAVVITNAGGGKVLGLSGDATDGAKVMTADYAKGDQAQLWKVVPAADGWSYIEHTKSGLVITVSGTSNGAEAKLARKKDGADGQLWKVTEVPNQKGSFKLVGKGSGDRVLAVDTGSKSTGFRILLWDDNGKPSSVYTLAPPK